MGNCSGTADFMCFTDGVGAGSGPEERGCYLSTCAGVLCLLGATGAAHKSAVSHNGVTDIPGHEFFLQF